MLNVPRFELARRGTEDVFAGDPRPRHHERHDILQLISEAVSSARLIKRRPCPHSAAERLIQQPPIDHDVHGAIGGLHLYGAERLIPKVRYLLECSVEIEGPVALYESDGGGGRHLLAEQERELGRFAGPQSERRLHRTAGIHAAAGPVRQGVGLQQCRGFRERSVAAEELRAIRRASSLPARHVHEGDTRR